MLRVAACRTTERRLRVSGLIHDAILLEATSDQIDQAVAECQTAMQEASSAVLDGFSLRSDVKLVHWPDRHSDPRGAQFWITVMELIDEIRGSEAGTTCIAALH